VPLCPGLVSYFLDDLGLERQVGKLGSRGPLARSRVFLFEG